MTFHHGRLPKDGALFLGMRRRRMYRNIGSGRFYISVPRRGYPGAAWSVRIGRFGWWWGWYNR